MIEFEEREKIVYDSNIDKGENPDHSHENADREVEFAPRESHPEDFTEVLELDDEEEE